MWLSLVERCVRDAETGGFKSSHPDQVFQGLRCKNLSPFVFDRNRPPPHPTPRRVLGPFPDTSSPHLVQTRKNELTSTFKPNDSTFTNMSAFSLKRFRDSGQSTRSRPSSGFCVARILRRSVVNSGRTCVFAYRSAKRIGGRIAWQQAKLRIFLTKSCFLIIFRDLYAFFEAHPAGALANPRRWFRGFELIEQIRAKEAALAVRFFRLHR